MSQITYRANLSAKSFPFLSQNWGRTIIVPQYDNTFSRQLTSQEDPDKDVGIPQIFYCHNVMPHSQGFQSVGYDLIFTGTQTGSGGPTDQRLTTVFPFYGNGANNLVYLSQALGGDVWSFNGTAWKNVASSGGFGGFGTLSTATVNGTSYALLTPFLLTYNYGADTTNDVTGTVTGITVANINGITDSFGYMIAWDNQTVYWSSTISPVDFTPSLITGAGSQSVEQAKGRIVACVHHTLGFFIYTTGNVIAALYTGNARYPFTFREIVGSGGISTDRLIAHDANTSNHYAYTTSGLQAISSTQTQTVSPELTDFLSGKIFEDYNESTDTFTVTSLTTLMRKAVSLVSDRYLIISYGLSSNTNFYTHAIVYDMIMTRYGKLKIDHTTCFQYDLPNAAVTEQPRQSIAFLQLDGTIRTVAFTPYSTNSDGVIMLGKYQFVRPRLLTLDEINIENVEQGASFKCYDLVALDGKNGTRVDYSTLESSGQYRKLAGRAIGINHSLVMVGRFFLTSLVLTFHIDGKR